MDKVIIRRDIRILRQIEAYSRWFGWRSRLVRDRKTHLHSFMGVNLSFADIELSIKQIALGGNINGKRLRINQVALVGIIGLICLTDNIGFINHRAHIVSACTLPEIITRRRQLERHIYSPTGISRQILHRNRTKGSILRVDIRIFGEIKPHTERSGITRAIVANGDVGLTPITRSEASGIKLEGLACEIDATCGECRFFPFSDIDIGCTIGVIIDQFYTTLSFKDNNFTISTDRRSFAITISLVNTLLIDAEESGFSSEAIVDKNIFITLPTTGLVAIYKAIIFRAEGCIATIGTDVCNQTITANRFNLPGCEFVDCVAPSNKLTIITDHRINIRRIPRLGFS